MNRRQAYEDMQMAARANRMRASGQQPMLLPQAIQLEEGIAVGAHSVPSELSAIPEALSRVATALQSYVSAAPSELALDAVSESVFIMP